MAGMALEILHGRLTRDPEQKDIKKKDGTTTKMTAFTVAVDARWGENTYFHDCTAWGKTGELIANYFHKGSEIIVYGEPIYNKKPDEHGGADRKYWSLNVDKWQFCGTKANADAADAKDGFEQLDDDTPF